ncbi:MAG TPA: dockerin type I repeat-containing protein [bacterium]|nr:dockerin type I repeat-containing protein [bacterium]
MIGRIALSFAVCLISVAAAQAATPVYVGVLEDGALAPQALAGLRGELSSQDFTFLRPLMGALAGKGTAWRAPEAMPRQEALALPLGIAGVLGTKDLIDCDNAWLCECSRECFPFVTFLYVQYESGADREAADAELQARGFFLTSGEPHDLAPWRPGEYVVYGWLYLRAEYRYKEARDLAKVVPGVKWVWGFAYVFVDGAPVLDVTGDGRLNILDLVYVRNRLGQDPESGDNLKADINGDGRINILDLIILRNLMSS